MNRIKKKYPETIVWELTAQCNQNCLYCYNFWTGKNRKRPGDIPENEIQIIIDNIRSSGIHIASMTLSGGEPLLRKDIFSIIQRIKNGFPNIQLNIASNGILCTPRIAKELKKAGISVLQLTLLSSKPGVHDNLTVHKGSFQKVLDAIYLAKSAGLGVAVFFVATYGNILDFPGTAKLAVACGADMVVFNRFHPGGRGLARWKALTPSHDQLSSIISTIKTLKKSISITFGTIMPPCEINSRPGRSYRISSCPVGTRNAYPVIGPDGNMRVCNHSEQGIGNLLVLPFKQVIKSMNKIEGIPPECMACHYVKTCGGGCLIARQLIGERMYNIKHTS